MDHLRQELKTVFEFIHTCDEIESLLNDDGPVTAIDNHAQGEAA